MSHELVYVDEGYDRRMASDGVSRFGSYLRRSRLLAGAVEEPLDAVGFAAEVWRVATSPVMSPGYVLCDGRVHDVQCHPGVDEPDVLVADVEVRLPHSRRMPGPGLAGWRDWARTATGVEGQLAQLVDPDEGVRAVLFTARLRLPIRVEDLPTPGDCLDVAEAKATVGIVASAINARLGPAVAELLEAWAGVGR